MAAKCKQQTVQFLFEASPENNITRCLTSKTSNTLENNDERSSLNDRHQLMGICEDNNSKDSTNTMGNAESNSFLQQDLRNRQRSPIAENYIPIEEKRDKLLEDKEHLDSRSSSVTSNGKTMLLHEDHFDSLLKGRRENTMISLNGRGKKKDIEGESRNNFKRKLNDENESKYLHVINHDMKERPISIVKSFDYGQNYHQSSNGIENKTGDGLSQVFNGLIAESNTNFVLGYNHVRQLPDLGNPQGLQEKQTKLHVHIASNNVINITSNEHINDDETFKNEKQPGKVRNLIHDYELQVKENNIDDKAENLSMRKNHLGDILKAGNLQPPYSECNNTASNQSRINYISSLSSEEAPLTEPAEYLIRRQENVLHNSTKDFNGIISTHLAIKKSNTINLLEKQPRVSGGDHIELKTRNSVKSTTPANNVNVSNKDNAIFIHNTYSAKQLSNIRKITEITEYTPKPGGNKNYQHLRPEARKITPGYQSKVTGSPLITRAHWYDIHNQSQKALHLINPKISKDDNILILPKRNENIFVSPSSKKDNPISPSLTAKNNTKQENRFHKLEIWKSLGELDVVEEYKLPEKLNKTTGYSTNEQADFNKNLATTYFNAITGYDEFTSVRKNKTIQNTHVGNTNKTQSFHAKPSFAINNNNTTYDSHRTQFLNANEEKQDPSQTIKRYTTQEKFDQNSMKQSPSPTRKKERSSGHVQKVKNKSDSVLYNKNNLSFSQPNLQTFDQSPMKRSKKIKNLVNIEYYDINSDEELNIKIERRPRTKSLNEERKTTKDVALRIPYKSTEDLRSIGLGEKCLASDGSAGDKKCRFDTISVDTSRTHCKYAEFDPTGSNSQTHIEKTKTAGISFCNEDDVEKNTPKSSAKRCTQKLYNCARHNQSTKEKAFRSIVYPKVGISAKEGKYNIEIAEEEWRKKYGIHPYNNKVPLHHSSDKEFGRLFQHSDSNIKRQNTQKTATSSSLLKDNGHDTSSSLFSLNKNQDGNFNQSHELSTTLDNLSSYVLSGYKVNQLQPSQYKQKNSEENTFVRYKLYYLDNEGDLSYLLDDSKESPKLSMLVHAIIRLREVYTIEHYNKPQTLDHPTNLRNLHLRDAIQNKPMSVVKDLILANKSVDINIRSQSGNSALHRAATEGDVDAIRILINEGADVNIRDKQGYQPVHQALRSDHYKAAMLLMDGGTDLMSYTSKRIQEFVNVKAIATQYLRRTLKTPL